MNMGATKARVERLGDERDRTKEKLADLHALAEDEERDLNEYEVEQAAKFRTRIGDLEEEIVLLVGDIEADGQAVDVSTKLRDAADPESKVARPEGAVTYRTFAEYARDQIIVHHPDWVKPNAPADFTSLRDSAAERLERTLQNTTSSGVAGIIIPTHMTQILDIIDRSRPVVQSGRQVPLDRGSMTYPSITTRPTVVEQTSEKTEGGTVAPAIASNTLTAKTYLGAANISWQAVNWSNPNVLELWFDLAAEGYARETEERACDVLEDNAGIGTVGTASGRLGTAGTESFSAWRAAVSAGVAAIYSATSGRHRTNTLYLSANRFFQLATLGTDQVAQMSPLGNVDMGSMTGNFFGMNVVGSYGFDQDTAIVGDSQALLVGENPGNPVEMRVVEPSIGGYEIGLIGAFNAVVFDANRFYHLGTHL